ITSGSDGALWFTEPIEGKIGRITVQGKISEFPLPTSFGKLGEITSGPDGALWFTESSSNTAVGPSQIRRITVQGKISDFPLPTDLSSPQGITSGPDGALWFTDDEEGAIGRITPQSTSS
ncbi:MAG: Virginiamycin B lyase, partial [Ktedonobacteraceae bacterium]|nr:Virginiamycin B lyase [Ktedonobacteraceae bacterium]